MIKVKKALQPEPKPEIIPWQKKVISKSVLIILTVLFIVICIPLFYLLVISRTSIPVGYIPASEQAVKKDLVLMLDSPSENQLTINNEMLVKGKTEPNIAVLVYTDSDQASLNSDENGDFETTILLDSGINTLTIGAYASDGREKEIQLDVVQDAEI